jgi:hypothetical protein
VLGSAIDSVVTILRSQVLAPTMSRGTLIKYFLRGDSIELTSLFSETFKIVTSYDKNDAPRACVAASDLPKVLALKCENGLQRDPHMFDDGVAFHRLGYDGDSETNSPVKNAATSHLLHSSGKKDTDHGVFNPADETAIALLGGQESDLQSFTEFTDGVKALVAQGDLVVKVPQNRTAAQGLGPNGQPQPQDQPQTVRLRLNLSLACDEKANRALREPLEDSKLCVLTLALTLY